MKEMENNMVGLAKELELKQIWVRSGLVSFLEKWAQETDTDLNDSSLKNLKLVDVAPADKIFISRGCAFLLTASKDAFAFWDAETVYDRANSLDVSDLDFKIVKRIVKALPEKLKEYTDRLKQANAECEKLVELAQKLKEE